MPFAAWLAETWNLPVRLLHVTGSISSDDPKLAEAATEARNAWPDLTFETEHLYGDDPAATIAEAVGAHSLPVLSTEHADAWSFKSSVAEALVERVGVPLVLVGPQASQPKPGDVVVALDGSPLADVAVETAATLAGALGRNLSMVRVVPQATPDEELHPEFGLDLQRRADGLDPALAPRWEVIHSNDPVHAIDGFAERVEASFVVAAARGRTDESRSSMSSITMGLVATAARPVLVVPPNGSAEADG